MTLRHVLSLMFLISLNPLWAERVFDSALAAMEAGEYKKAEFLLNRAKTQGIQPMLADYNLAYVYFKTDRVQSALNQYENILMSVPTFKQAYHNIGRIYYQYAEYALAIRAFKRYLEINEKDKDTHLLLGDVHKKIRDHGASEYHYLRALELDPKETDGYLALADFYLEVDDSERALTTIQEGILEASQITPLLEKEADIYADQKKYLDSAVTLEQVLKQTNLDADQRYFIRLRMANHYIDARFPRLAIEALEIGIQNFPKKAAAVELLSYIYQSQDEWESAFELYASVFGHHKKIAYLGMREVLRYAYNQDAFDLQARIVEFYKQQGIRDELLDLIKGDPLKKTGEENDP